MFQLALASKFCSEVLSALSCQHCKTDMIIENLLHDLYKNDMMMYFIYCLFDSDQYLGLCSIKLQPD